jgi:hypothetical protein
VRHASRTGRTALHTFPESKRHPARPGSIVTHLRWARTIVTGGECRRPCGRSSPGLRLLNITVSTRDDRAVARRHSHLLTMRKTGPGLMGLA